MFGVDKKLIGLLPLNQTKFFIQIFHGTLNFSYYLIVSHFKGYIMNYTINSWREDL